MASITLIAAIGKNGELGINNSLIWKIPEDLKFFRETTINKPIVMGINTLNSLPKLLPNRKHIVLTHRDVALDYSVIVFHNLNDLLTYIDFLDGEVMVIGGAQVYRQMISYADNMILTEINEEAIADVYFPTFSRDEWDRNIISTHQFNDTQYSHVMYKKKRC